MPDAVSLQGTSPPPASAEPLNPWPALEKAGLLPFGPVVTGPLGMALEPAVREGLRQACRRMTEGGARFFEIRRGQQEPCAGLSSDDFSSALERETLPLREAYIVTVPGAHRALPVRCLGHLRALDVTLGLGPEAAGRQEPAARALRIMADQGWEFCCTLYSGELGGRKDLPSAWRALSSGDRIVATPPNTRHGRDSLSVTSPEDLLALNYFHGDRQDLGLADGTRAEALRTLQDHGHAFSNDPFCGFVDRKDAYEIYLKGVHPFRVGFEEGAMVDGGAVTPDGIPALEKQIEEAQDIFVHFAEPVLAPLDGLRDRHVFMQAAYRNDVAPVLSPSLRAQALARLMEHAYGTDALTKLRYAEGDLAAMSRPADPADALMQRVEWWSDMQLQDVAGKASPSDRTWARDGITRLAATPEREREMRSTLKTLVERTGDLSSAREAFNLLRIPVSGETGKERLELFGRVASREDPPGCARAVDDYRNAMICRRPDEPLEPAVERICTLLDMLRPFGAQERSAEVVAGLEKRMQDGGDGDALLSRFGARLLHNRSVDEALASWSEPDPVPSQAPCEVRPEAGSIVIGGVRIPLRSSLDAGT